MGETFHSWITMGKVPLYILHWICEKKRTVSYRFMYLFFSHPASTLRGGKEGEKGGGDTLRLRDYWPLTLSAIICAGRGFSFVSFVLDRPPALQHWSLLWFKPTSLRLGKPVFKEHGYIRFGLVQSHSLIPNRLPNGLPSCSCGVWQSLHTAHHSVIFNPAILSKDRVLTETPR